MAKVYISSTFSDLKEYRHAVYTALRQLRHDVISMEDYVAADQRPLDKCLADIAACDVYVGIFAWRYGYIPDENNPLRKSITELEYRHAVECHKPILVFLLDLGLPWPRPLMDEVTGEGEKGQQIAALRKELGQEKLCSSFKTPDQLASLVSIAVKQQAARALSDDASVDPAIIYGYLQRVRSRFIEHMKQVSGAASEEDALKRYLPQRLQEVYSESAEQSAAASDPLQAVPHQINDELVMSGVGNGRMTRFVSLQDSIKTNAAVLVLGEVGSGKTTLLLHEASQLAIQARNDSKAWIPIFLPLNTVNNTAHNPLLAQMAHVNDLKPSLLNALWKRRRLCVLLEGGEHLPRHHVPALAEAIGSLHKDNLDGKHRIVVACRTGSSLCKELEKTKPGFHNVVMPSLNSNEIKDFLVRYDVPELARRLNESLHEVAQSPELLAALARSYRDKVWPDVPRNAGQIYSHLINNFLCPDNRGSYDYYHIKRPVLSSLAYMMVRGQDSGMSNNDLCEHVATLLELCIDAIIVIEE